MSKSEVYSKLAERLKYPESTHLLQILERMITPEEGRLLLELPAPIVELSKKLDRDEEAIKTSMRDLLRRGLVIATRSGYVFPRNIIVMHDSALSVDAELLGPEVSQLWKDWYEAEWSRDAAEDWKRLEGPLTRCVPSWKWIEAFRKISPGEVLPYEDPKQIIEKADLIAVRRCACRTMMRNCDHPVETCLQFDNAAEYILSRPTGRKVSVDEAMALLDSCEESGLVHLVFNRSSRINSMCNCCAEACIVINASLKHGILSGSFAKSRFEAVVDEELCTGCQDCVERCNFDAITMEKPAGSKKYKARIDPDKCWGCGLCFTTCEPGAISLKLVRPATHIPDEPGRGSLRDEWVSASELSI